MPSYRFYDNLSMVSLGALVIFGVGGLAIFLGVSAAGGIAALGDSWDQESGLTWLTLTSVGTVVSLVLLVWSCAGKQAHIRRQRKDNDIKMSRRTRL